MLEISKNIEKLTGKVIVEVVPVVEEERKETLADKLKRAKEKAAERLGMTNDKTKEKDGLEL